MADFTSVYLRCVYKTSMKDSLVQVKIQGILPAPGGSGVFLAAEKKVITIFIDSMVTRALQLAVKKENAPRPLTHDLFSSALAGLGVKIVRVIIHDFSEETYYARLHLEQKNELGQSHLEVDARPSDCLVLALQNNAPVFISRKVWEEAEDMSWAMDQLSPGDNEA